MSTDTIATDPGTDPGTAPGNAGGVNNIVETIPPQVLSAGQLELIAALVTETIYGTTWLSTEQVCEWMQIRREYLYALVAKKKIPHVKIGRLLRFKRTELDQWVETYRQIGLHDVAREESSEGSE